MEKLQRLTTMVGRSSTLRCHFRWRGSIDSAGNGCWLRGESPEIRLARLPKVGNWG